MISQKVNFHVYPFTMARPYAVGVLLVVLGIRFIYLLGNPISLFDLYFTLGIIISIAAVSTIKSPRFTLLSLVKIFTAVILLLLPFLIGELLMIYLPYTYYHSFEGFLMWLFSYLMVDQPPLTLSISIIILLLGISLIIYAVASSLTVKVKFTDDGLIVEEGFLKPIHILIPFSEIIGVEVLQNRFGELFNYGDLVIIRRMDSINVEGIEKPWLLKKYVTNRIQELTARRIEVSFEDLAGTLEFKEMCKICLKPLINGSSTLSLIKCPYCGAVFHDQCMSLWLKTINTCPNCGANLLNILGIRRGG